MKLVQFLSPQGLLAINIDKISAVSEAPENVSDINTVIYVDNDPDGYNVKESYQDVIRVLTQ